MKIMQASISHDLRAPIQSITMIIDSLIQKQQRELSNQDDL
jgi:K+-sensing histidine kinase KdpD